MDERQLHFSICSVVMESEEEVFINIILKVFINEILDKYLVFQIHALHDYTVHYLFRQYGCFIHTF